MAQPRETVSMRTVTPLPLHRITSPAFVNGFIGTVDHDPRVRFPGNSEFESLLEELRILIPRPGEV